MLRAWSFKYNEETKMFSREPDHNFASHGGDAFSYGAQMLAYAKAKDKPKPAPVGQGVHMAFTLDMCERWSGPTKYLRS